MTQWSAWDAFFARIFLLYGLQLRGATLTFSGRNYSFSHLHGWDRALRGGVGIVNPGGLAVACTIFLQRARRLLIEGAVIEGQKQHVHIHIKTPA